MLKRVEKFAPTVVEEIRPETLRMGTLHQVLVQLAEDRIPLNDLALILESIVNHAATVQEVNALTDKVRSDLGRLVCERFRNQEGMLRVITLAPQLDSQLRQSMHEGQLAIGPVPLGNLIQQVAAAWQDSHRKQQDAALLVDKALRRPLKQVLARSVAELGIIGYQEVPFDMIIDSVSMIPHEAIFPARPKEQAAA